MTIKDVAREAGVSVSTVSKIINNKADSISPATIERVLEIAKKNHYVPYGRIKNTLNTKSFTLSVMLRSVSASPGLLQGFVSQVQEKNYAVLIFDSSSSQQQEDSNFRTLSLHRIDGLLWEPVSSGDRKEISLDNSVHLQTLDRSTTAWYAESFREFGRLMTHHLITLGHTAIAFVGTGTRVDSTALLDGYKQALYDHHIPFEPMRILTGNHKLAELVSSGGVTALVCANPVRANEAINQLSAAGFSVPKDISIIAPADDTMYPSHHISLQRIPYETYGRTLAEILIARCEDRKPELVIPQPLLNLTGTATVDRAPTSRKRPIIVLGSINADITLNVNRLPGLGSNAICHSVSTNLGGKGANQAMGVARLDWPACLISKVGNDTDAAMALQELNGAGINTEGVRRDLDNITGKAYIHVQEDGENILTLVQGANHAITAKYVQSMEYLFQNAGYCLLSNGPPPECVLQAAQLARKHDVKTLFKPSLHTQIPPQLYPMIDIFIPNRHAARHHSPFESPEQQADYFLAQGAKNVIITLGHQGCYLRTPHEEFWYSSPHVVSVDSTGAADAFISALAVYLLRSFSLPDAVEAASHAAGFCVTKQGVIPALVDRASLDLYLSTAPRLIQKHAVRQTGNGGENNAP